MPYFLEALTDAFDGWRGRHSRAALRRLGFLFRFGPSQNESPRQGRILNK